VPDKLLHLALGRIDEGERFRKVYDLDDLVDSIQERGILQPITVSPGSKRGQYVLLAGGRRLAAARKLELESIPCLVREIDGELDLREIEYIENSYRKDLTWTERLDLVVEIHRLMREKFGSKWNQRKTAEKLERSVGGVNRLLQLNEMIKKFPSLKEEPTEDDAVKKARKILEAVTVKNLVDKHRSEADTSDPDSILRSLEGPETGEGFKDDPFISRCRRADTHYRIGDAFAEMEEIIKDPNISPAIALVEVDPPYGIDLRAQKKGDETRALQKYEEVEGTKYQEFTARLCRDLFDITPKDCSVIYWFAMDWYSVVTEELTKVGFEYDPIPCIWVKPSGQTNSPDRYLARTYETFLFAWKGDGIPLRGRGRSNVFSFAPVPAARKYHPTQRPIELMREILRVFAWPDTIILVPFLGSGVTLRACYAESMLGFGWEINGENKPKFLAAVETDIQEYKVGNDPEDDPDDDIPF